MTTDELLAKTLTVEGDVATVRFGDLDWNGILLDLVDWNEMSSREADSIIEDAFGHLPDDGNAAPRYDEWLDVQRAWTWPYDETISVAVVRDADGDADLPATTDAMREALVRFCETEIHLTDEQRGEEVRRLRAAYPHLVAD